MPDGSNSHVSNAPETGSALGKAVTVLSALLNADAPPSLNELAEKTELPRPTVHRVIMQLVESGLICRTPDGSSYVVGPKLMTLAVDTFSAVAQSAPVRTVLRRLVDDVGETCNLGVLDRDSVVYIDRIECDWPLRLQIGIGSRVPIHATAIGKILLAYLPARTRRRVLGSAPLKRFTENTLVNPAEIEKHLKTVRRLGYACNAEENTLGLIGIAVPVRDGQGRAVAGLSVHAPKARLSVADAVALYGRFRSAADEIEGLIAETRGEQA